MLHIIKTTDWKRKNGANGRSAAGARHLDHIVLVCFECYLTPLFFLASPFLFVAHEEMRKLIETMPHPTRVDSLSWKLKYFYESCTALEHIVVPEQKLIRVIDQMGMETIFVLFHYYFISLSHSSWSSFLDIEMINTKKKSYVRMAFQ